MTDILDTDHSIIIRQLTKSLMGHADKVMKEDSPNSVTKGIVLTHDEKTAILLSALATSLMCIVDLNDKSLVTLQEGREHFLAIGKLDVSDKSTKSLISHLSHLKRISELKDSSLNAITAKEIMAEIESEHGQSS